MLHVLDDLEDGLHGGFQGFDGALLFGDDLLPVPLVYVAGVEVVKLLIAADGVHVGVKAFARLKAVFLQCHTFPFCEGMYDLNGLSRDCSDVELDRTLYAV